MNSKLTKIVLTSVFAALVFVGTYVIHIAIPATGGYINIGDAAILIAAWSLGGAYAGLAAGIGAGLVDLVLGPVYVPGTLVIKFLMALVASIIFFALSTKGFRKTGYVVSAFVAEVIMILGYLLYEGVFLGLGLGAFAGVYGNVIQGVASIVIGVVAVEVLEKTKVIAKIKSYV
ncbi:MAG: ECF transporter S component [Eubacterium sp.]|nr:ECF transporter S component [Eubacterium sp.]